MSFRKSRTPSGGGAVEFAAPSKVLDIGDQAEQGTSPKALRSDAQFAFPAPDAPVDVGDTADAGNDSRPARGNHRHRHQAADHLAGGHANLLPTLDGRYAALAAPAAAVAGHEAAADPHGQYLNNTRGDLRYPTRALLTAKGGLFVRDGTGAIVELLPGPNGQLLSADSTSATGWALVPPPSSTGIQPTIIDAAGELIVGTAPDTPARFGAPTATDQVLTADLALGPKMKWATPARGRLLAQLAYLPGTDQTHSTTSATFSDVDATNLKISGVVIPPSGVLVVGLSAGAECVNGTGSQVQWRVIPDGGGSWPGVVANHNASLVYTGLRIIVITGQTPGTTVNLRWQSRQPNGAQFAYTRYGPTYGQAVMLIWEGV